MIVSFRVEFSVMLALTVLGPQLPKAVSTATPLSERLVVDETCPDHGNDVGVTSEQRLLPVNLADVMLMPPAAVTLPAIVAVQLMAMPDFVSVVEPVKLIGPAGETVTAYADAEAARNNANAAPTGMSLKLFMLRTSH